MDITIWSWIAFNAVLLTMLVLSRGAFRRRTQRVTVGPQRARPTPQ